MGQTKEEFIYINFQGTFGNIDPCSTPEETTVCIDTPNKRKNYYNTMEFITDEARRDQMTDDYILIHYILKAGLRNLVRSQT